MTFDEFYFHERRGLPLWEKIGHPFDTFFTFVTLSIPAFFPFSESLLSIYILISIFSTLFITKDEFVHIDHCCKMEMWVHSLLFILHPLTFFATYIVWIKSPENLFLKVQPVVVGSFMFYQIIRWSIPWHNQVK